MKRDFDIIVYGATGYTGRLIAEYLATSYCDKMQTLVSLADTSSPAKWSMLRFSF